jgi:hypothetical protein
VTVTAQDEITTKTYRVIVIRQSPAKSNDVSIGSILVDNQPAIAKTDNHIIWEITVDYATHINITATAGHQAATIDDSYLGIKSVRTGLNIFEIEVTAEDGSTQKYSLEVTVNELFNSTEDGYGQRITVYPNPANEQITVSGLEASGFIIVFDTVGRPLIQHQITSPQEKIHVHSLPQGIYLIQIIEGEKTSTIKIVVD